MLRWIIPFALGVVVPVGMVHGQNRGSKSATPASAKEYGYLKNAKTVGGTLVAFDVLDRSLTLRVDIPHFEPNPSYRPPTNSANNSQAAQIVRQIQQHQQNQFRAYQNLARRQRAVMTARTPQQRQQALRQVAQEMARIKQQEIQHQARLQQSYMNMYKSAINSKKSAANSKNQPFKVVYTTRDFELDVEKDVVIRTTYLPVEFDDTGNFKVYTEEEKAKLRGTDRSKPGYHATLQQVQRDAMATVYLKPADKREGRPDDDLEAVVRRPSVRMIVLTKAGAGDEIQGAR